MATNVFFNNFESSQEQLLIEDLVIESIQTYGHDVYYLPKTLVSKDTLYGADDLTIYGSYHLIEMYIRNVEGFEGEGDLFSRFGVEIRDQITFTVAQRTFDSHVGALASITRPNEGDIIFLPLNKKPFKIMHVEHEAIFYQMGSLQTYDLTCELFEYSHERFNTGLDMIDKIERNNAQTRTLYVTSTSGTWKLDETVRQVLSGTDYIQGEIQKIVANNDASGAFSLDIGNIRSDYANTIFFEAGATLTGVSSSATATIGSRLSENLGPDDQNDFFETQGDNILDFSDADPFSQGGDF